MKLKKTKAAPVIAPLDAPEEAPPQIVDGEATQLISPNGQWYDFPANSIDKALEQGFRQPTTAETTDRADKNNYGKGIVNELKAGVLGGARGASFGLSDLAIRGAEHAGILPQGTLESTEKLAKYNPDATTAGEMASFLLPALGGIKALGTAGKVASSAGILQALTQRGGSALGKVAAKIVGERLGSVAAPAASLALQSALFQAGKNISEDSLADKDLTAESILAHTGQAAILGAGLGAAVPVIAMAGKAAIKAAAPLAAGPIESAIKFFDGDRSRALFSGGASSTGAPKAKLWADSIEGNRFQGAVKHLGEEGLYARGEIDLDHNAMKIVQTADGALPNTSQVYERTQDLLEKTGRVIGASLEATDAMAAKAGVAPMAAQITSDELDAFASKVHRWKNNDRITASAAKQLDDDILSMATHANAKESNLTAMHQMRRDLDQRIGGNNFLKLAGEEIEQVKDMRKLLSSKIDAGMSQLEQSGIVPPDTLGRWKRANKLASSLYAIEKPLNQALGGIEANTNAFGLRWRDQGSSVVGSMLGGAIGGPLGAGVGAMAGFAGKALQTDKGLLWRAELGDKLKMLGWAEKLTDMSKTQIADSMKAFVSNSAVAKIAGEGASRLGMPIAYAMSDRQSPTGRTKSQHDWFDETSKSVLATAADPRGFAEKQSQELQHLGHVAPGLAEIVVQKQLQVYDYLLQTMPKNPAPAMNILNNDWKPPDYEVLQWRKVVQVARAPLSMLDNVRNGTASQQQVQAVQTLYPKLYAQMAVAAQTIVADPATKLNYNQRLKLSALFGGQGEQTLAPAFVAAMQSPQATPDDHDKLLAKGPAPSFSKRNQTSTERTASR